MVVLNDISWCTYYHNRGTGIFKMIEQQCLLSLLKYRGCQNNDHILQCNCGLTTPEIKVDYQHVQESDYQIISMLRNQIDLASLLWVVIRALGAVEVLGKGLQV